MTLNESEWFFDNLESIQYHSDISEVPYSTFKKLSEHFFAKTVFWSSFIILCDCIWMLVTVSLWINRYTSNISDPKDLEKEPFNVTLEDVWSFAPRFLVDEPFPVVVCLIWTSPFTKTIPKEWSILVNMLDLLLGKNYWGISRSWICYQKDNWGGLYPSFPL